MQRLLIVDDMPIITDDLADMFMELEHLELEVFKAYSPYEAIGIMNSHKIDIILSDIMMPGMSGLELLKEIRSQWPRSKVIFLTSYQDFQYVKEAISMGGAGYLLKTEGDAVIIEAVERAARELREEWKRNDLVQRSEAQFQAAKPSMQRELLMSMLANNTITAEQRRKQFAEMEMRFDPDSPVYMMITRMDGWKEAMTFSNRNLLHFALRNILEEYLSGSVVLNSISYDKDSVVWFLQPHKVERFSEKGWQRYFRFIYGTMETVQHTCRELLKLQVSVIVHTGAVSWEAIAPTFHRLDLLFHQGIGLNKEILTTDEQLDNMRQEHRQPVARASVPNNRLPHVDYYPLSELLKLGRREEFMTIFNELMNGLRAEEGTSATATAAQRMEIFHLLSFLLLSCTNRWNTDFASLERFEGHKLLSFNPLEAWQEYEAYFHRLFTAWFAFKSSEQQDHTKQIVSEIHAYIGRNLSGDLSLTSIGEFVHLNPNYLSRLYKMCTGKSLTDYMAEVRIKAAKEMLGTSLKIQEIAEAVGFLSGTAFARFFRTHMSMTPQEYRDHVFGVKK
ncbi:response regulator [Paenibacillus koleovorans]|uniref:response regulator n=1 Tax=Paenibacillus koleovorans TaxID=121608 RepID=UPI000FD80AA8|nr:response regulator [Paenibacillus koleovorans]